MTSPLSTIKTVEHVRPDIARSLDAIHSALTDMRFGAITLSVHDGRVVQLDVTERTRFQAGA